MPRNGHASIFSLSQPLRKVELDSTFRNDCGNAATIFPNIAQCNTPHNDSCNVSHNVRFVLVSQLKRSTDSRESSVVAVARRVARILAQCNTSGLATLQRKI